MVLNNNGQVVFYSLMLGVTIIVLALALAYPVKSFVDTARSPDNLDCGNDTISNFDKGACIVTDISLFYFIGGMIAIGGTVLVAKIIFS